MGDKTRFIGNKTIRLRIAIAWKYMDIALRTMSRIYLTDILGIVFHG